MFSPRLLYAVKTAFPLVGRYNFLPNKIKHNIKYQDTRTGKKFKFYSNPKIVRTDI